jgi:hypothetical protein
LLVENLLTKKSRAGISTMKTLEAPARHNSTMDVSGVNSQGYEL